MPLPIKVSDVGRPLTCEEHDSNIDRLLDRANHTGTQSASTIYDLESYLNSLSTLINIKSLVNEYGLKIENLEEELTGNGFISNLIDSVKIALEQSDSILRQDINSLLSKIENLQRTDQNINDLLKTLSERIQQEELKSTSFTSRINTLEDLLEENIDKIDNLTTLVNLLNGNLTGINLNDLIATLNSLDETIRPLINGEKFLIPRPPNNSSGLILRWDPINEEPFWTYPDFINGGALIDPINEIRLTLNTAVIP